MSSNLLSETDPAEVARLERANRVKFWLSNGSENDGWLMSEAIELRRDEIKRLSGE